jgi:hypothetical protein
MTLPFRRRHHDDETSHDRARALTSLEMLEPLGGDDAGWLARHLEACAECRRDRAAFLADRTLLRSLRERTPEPPRDLWARTSAAIEREAGARRRRPARSRRSVRSMPFGAAAGALIVLVVIGASLVPPLAPNQQPGKTLTGAVSPDAQPTPFDVTPGGGRLAWLRPAANGSWELVTAKVAAVCPRTRPGCASLTEDDPGRAVALAGTPTGVTISPDEDQLVVSARGGGSSADKIYVVQVPPATPAVTPAPTELPTSGPTGTPGATGTPDATSTPAPTITLVPGTPAPTSGSIIEIASGVMVVGEAAYSDDGQWLAFSARPSDGSTGPDLYLWNVGQAAAAPVTSDHRTYFSTWFGGRVLASRVELTPAIDATAQPTAAATDEPTTGPTTEPSPDPSAHPGHAVEAHPASFLLDPATLARTDIAQPDLWLPEVDISGRFAAYWSGTLVPSPDGMDWELGKGQLVLSGWSDGSDADASPEPPTESPTADESANPESSPTPALGPVGSPVPLVQGHSAAFKAKFDPTSTRLAIWVGEQLNADVGRLHLVALDPKTGAVVSGPEPLPGAPALRRFSIDVGRLAWVSPSGQDGQESSVQVLGWSNTSFGELKTIPAKALYIVR